MKLFLIKFGKAINTLKREGIFRGGKRVMQSFLAMFRKVGRGDVLFITGGVGDSARYRTQHVAEELSLHGFRCSITVQDNPLITGYADKFKIFIFHRVLFTPSVAKLIEKIKAQNKEMIFETDDLVFDPQYLKFMDYFQKMNAFEKKLYENGVGGEILRDSYVAVCTTTTSYLAEKLEEYGKKVFIVPNKLSNRDLEITENIIKHKTHNIEHEGSNCGCSTNKKSSQNCCMLHVPCSRIKIGYFSGTISHNKDFATITEVLIKIMEKYPQVELVIVGPLDVENKLNKFKDRLVQLPYVSREKHFKNISQVDINLAPLEMNNPFCEAKSELKFFEAGILGIPTLAVANETYRKAIADGVDGFLASSEKEWYEKMEKLLLDENFRKVIGEKARAKVLEKYTNKKSQNNEYYAYLKAKVGLER